MMDVETEKLVKRQIDEIEFLKEKSKELDEENRVLRHQLQQAVLFHEIVPV